MTTTNTTQFHASVPAEIYPENLNALAPVFESRRDSRRHDSRRCTGCHVHAHEDFLLKSPDTSKQTYVSNVSQRDLQQMVKAQTLRGKTPYPASAVSDGPNGMVIPLPEKVALQLNSAIDAAQLRACKSADAHMAPSRRPRSSRVGGGA